MFGQLRSKDGTLSFSCRPACRQSTGGEPRGLRQAWCPGRFFAL